MFPAGIFASVAHDFHLQSTPLHEKTGALFAVLPSDHARGAAALAMIERHFDISPANTACPCTARAAANLGSRLIEFQSQNMTVAARAIAEKKVSG
ncbi:hypothetical protein, partial [Tabrizicola soli]